MNNLLKIVAFTFVIHFFHVAPAVAHGDSKHQEVGGSKATLDAGAQYFVRIESGFRIEGPSIIKLKRGDYVDVDFVSDGADELHLHGYDITLPLKPNDIARLSFMAKYAGRFSYELHSNDREIGVFEIHP